MITYRTGDMLAAGTQALVNTVNTVGVMGKGIALQFAERYKENLRVYKAACKSGELMTGTVLVVRDHDLHGERIIVNFPTKMDWKHKSKFEYIETGLVALVQAIKEHGIHSIALPPLGCGNGGLDWEEVKPLIERHLGGLDLEVVVYEPSAHVRDLLRKEPVQAAKLTPARSILLSALFQYERTGASSNLFVANKLAYFLQRLGDKSLRLKFEAASYGPYTGAVGHMLYHVNGAFLRGLEQKAAKPFEHFLLNYDRRAELEKSLTADQWLRLAALEALINGFHATSDLELLSSVAFILEHQPNADVSEVIGAMNKWSDRKGALAEPEKVAEAIGHLHAYEGAGRLF
ncbi:MAG: macro domain-containing protein [Flavobacteriales bacterium]|jgi:O-acetyl-ADP-ribose deacetylase (regulator of RNase III)|nr:macro domain-containing protein [Flavobacteriales bacterium]